MLNAVLDDISRDAERRRLQRLEAMRQKFEEDRGRSGVTMEELERRRASSTYCNRRIASQLGCALEARASSRAATTPLPRRNQVSWRVLGCWPRRPRLAPRCFQRAPSAVFGTVDWLAASSCAACFHCNSSASSILRNTGSSVCSAARAYVSARRLYSCARVGTTRSQRG
jgi:hypothetical protein